MILSKASQNLTIGGGRGGGGDFEAWWLCSLAEYCPSEKARGDGRQQSNPEGGLVDHEIGQ